MKWVLRGLGLVFILIVVAVVGIFIFLSTFNPNDYKDQIYTATKNAIGRDLKIEGDMRATLFPVLGFTVNGVTLSNPAGFGQNPFLKLQSAQVGVEILPLLHHQIRLTTVILDHPEIHVLRQKDGRSNLTFTPVSSTSPSTKTNASLNASLAASSQMAPSPFDIRVGKIKITNAVVTYDDALTNTKVQVDPLNLTLPGFTPGQPAQVDLDMTALVQKMRLQVRASGTTTLSSDQKELAIHGLQTDLTLNGAPVQGTMTTTLRGDGTLHLGTQTMEVNIDDFTAHYLDTSIKGHASFKGPLAAPAVTFAVSSPRVDLDPLSGSHKTGSATDDEASKSGATPSRAAASGPLFPVEVLRGLNLNGEIKIADLRTQNLALQDVSATLSAKDGNVRVAPFSAHLYKGTVTCQGAINVTQATPTLTLRTDLQNVQMGPLLAAKMGDAYVDGLARGTADLHFSGNSLAALQNSAGGTVQFSFDKGAVQKWQLSQLINQAIAIYKTKTLAPPGDDQLYFTGLAGTFTGQNGVFRNDDLVLSGPKFHAFGNGTVNIAQSRVDYTVQVGDGTPDRTAKHVPILISGPLTAPSYRVDAQSILTDVIKDKVEKKLKQKLLDKLGPFTGAGAEGGDGSAPAPGTAPGAAPGTATGMPTATPPSPEDVGKQLLRGLLQ